MEGWQQTVQSKAIQMTHRTSLACDNNDLLGSAIPIYKYDWYLILVDTTANIWLKVFATFDTLIWSFWMQKKLSFLQYMLSGENFHFVLWGLSKPYHGRAYFIQGQ